MLNGLIFSIVLLSKEILQIFLSSAFYLTGVGGLNILGSFMSNGIAEVIFKKSSWMFWISFLSS